MDTLQSFWNTVLSAPMVSVVLVVLALVILMLLALTLVVIQLGTRLRYLATPIFDQTIREAQQKADYLLAEAQKHATDLRLEAHAQAEKIIADRKQEDDQFRAAATAHLDELTQHAKGLLSTYDAQVKEAFGRMGTDTEAQYKTVVDEMKKRVTEVFEKDIAATQSAIAAYREERLKQLSERMVGLVEDTARIALNKAISLGDHRDLVLAALEEAKAEGIFGHVT